jgi:hypothetical protein
MSEFDTQREVYLIFGKNGWIGGKIIELLTQQGKTFFLAESRTYNRESVLSEIEKYNPTHILNAAGVTGRPNVDWCEDHRLETIRSNVIGTLTIADIAEEVSLRYCLHSSFFFSSFPPRRKIFTTLSLPLVASLNMTKPTPLVAKDSLKMTFLTSMALTTVTPRRWLRTCSEPIPTLSLSESACQSVMTSALATSSPRSSNMIA